MPPRFRFRARSEKTGEKISEPFEVSPELLLHSVAWDFDEYGHGEHAGMKVMAPALNGHKVKFIVEHRHGGGWEPQGTVTATVVNGVAKAKLPVQHPHVAGGGDPAEAEIADLRFSCELA